MQLMLLSLAVLDLLELSIYLMPFWQLRKISSLLISISLIAVSTAIFMHRTDGWSYLVLLIALYRTGNLLRVGYGVGTEEYLWRNGFTSSIILMMAQSAAILAWAISIYAHANGYQGWLLLAFVQLVIATVVLKTTLRQLKHTRPPEVKSPYPNSKLPSISVCIPARNETDVLESCLRSLVECDYQKLEILVLDDCSQDQTSDIIKSFAHDGVRFVRGSIAPDGWLAKNWAYQQLFEEANGRILIFCGVDVLFDASSLRQLVTTLLEKKKSMISVMPINALPAGSVWSALLVQPLRYAWELCIPRRSFNRPPVLSTCWAVERRFIKKVGSFKAVRSSVSPESHFARLAVETDSYSFVRSTKALGLISHKSFTDQMETATRTRYPQLHRRPELVLLVSFVETMGIIATLPVAIASYFVGQNLTAALSLTAFLLSAYAFYKVVLVTYHRRIMTSWLAVPFALLLDIGVRHYSMWRYEFSSVVWKGRNICLPVMRVERHLPPLPPKQTRVNG